MGGISSMGVMRPDMVMRSIIPVVMAGVLGIYGLITAVIINGKMEAATYSAYSGYAHLGAGLTVGMSSLAAGLAIGIVGDAGAGKRTAATSVRRYDFDLDLRRGLGLVWPHCWLSCGVNRRQQGQAPLHILHRMSACQNVTRLQGLRDCKFSRSGRDS